MRAPPFTGVRATALTPFHYRSLAAQDGVATIPDFLADRAMSYALCGAMGGFRPALPLPPKDYLRDLSAMPWLCSVFETDAPRLLPRLAKRLNLDEEGVYGAKIMGATGTGNLKTFYNVQEVPPETVYRGVIFGPDPFAMARGADPDRPDRLIVRTGRHRGGLFLLEPDPDVSEVRLNAHTAFLFGREPQADPEMGVEEFALYDMQLTGRKPVAEAARIVGSWRGFDA